MFHPQSGISTSVTVRVGVKTDGPEDGVYRIQNADSGLFLTVQNSGTSNGTPVVLSAKSDGAGQLFRIRTVDGVLYFYPLCSQNGNGKVLDVYRGSSASAPVQAGCGVDIWSYGDREAQEWTASLSGGQYVFSLVANSGLALTGSGKKVSVEAAGENGQSWLLTAEQEPSFSEGDALHWDNPLAVMTTTQPFGSGFSSSPAYWGHLAWDGIGASAVTAAA